MYVRLQPASGKVKERSHPRVLGLDLGQDPSCPGNGGAKRSPTDPALHLHSMVRYHSRSGRKASRNTATHKCIGPHCLAQSPFTAEAKGSACH